MWGSRAAPVTVAARSVVAPYSASPNQALHHLARFAAAAGAEGDEYLSDTFLVLLGLLLVLLEPDA